MNKRISDEELNAMKLLHPMKGKKYDVTISSVDLLDLCNDLQDAREELKNYVYQKPSLSEHLQKLANKHMICFALSPLHVLFAYVRGTYFTVNAEDFFGFDKDFFNCDVEVNEVIYPEVNND